MQRFKPLLELELESQNIPFTIKCDNVRSTANIAKLPDESDFAPRTLRGFESRAELFGEKVLRPIWKASHFHLLGVSGLPNAALHGTLLEKRGPHLLSLSATQLAPNVVPSPSYCTISQQETQYAAGLLHLSF